jgi:hypothetical protein
LPQGQPFSGQHSLFGFRFRPRQHVNSHGVSLIGRQVAALEANREALGRHRYIGVGWRLGALWPPRLAALEDALDVELLHLPLNLEALIAAVARAAEQLLNSA